ncbi:MAG: c-type cytochrome [Acidobacteria bacterium]|nr:MAG: c-type cytochrome [Acidobacteriota bacterium]
MSRRSLVALGIITITGALAVAQAPAAGGGQRAGGTPPPMKNLQVLPKDTPQPQVVAMMRAFNAALGVNCDHCHVWTKPGAPTNDMASDEKAAKLVAREMMRMTNDVNTRLAAAIKKPADQIAKVECATCHRGAAIPVLPPPAPAANAPAAAPAK